MTHSWFQYIANEPLNFFKLSSSLFIFCFQKKIEYIFISSKNNFYLQKACKLIGDETNIEQPSKYGYYSSVYPFWFKENL